MWLTLRAIDRGMQIIQRDRLVSCLHEHIDSDYRDQIRIHHSVEVGKVEQDEEGALHVHWRGQEGRCGQMKAPFLVSESQLPAEKYAC